MATTSSILELIDLALGESASGGYLNWGEVADANFATLEKAVGEVSSIAVTAADVTLSDAEHNSLFIKATGILTADRAIKTQDRKGFWFVTNGCTADFSLTFKTTSGAGIVIPQGATAILASDGTNVLRIATLPSGGKAPGAATLQSKAAGFTAGVADNGNFFECTAALTMAIKPAALLGADWAVSVKAQTGTTVIDPNGAELINGAATLSLTVGQSALVFCTGAAFRAIVMGDATRTDVALVTPTLDRPTLDTPASRAFGGHIFGLTLSNNGADATNDIDIAIGSAASDDAVAVDMPLTAAITKRLDAAWAVGSAAGGLDTGAIANTTYHVWLIRRPDTGVVDALFSASATAPTMPANYTQKRRIGSVIRSGGALVAFRQAGDTFILATPVTDRNSVAAAASALLTLSVPLGINVYPLLQSTLSVSASDVVTNGLGDAAAGSANVSIQTESTLSGDDVSASIATPPPIFRTNTSAQLYFACVISLGAPTNNILATLGWIDRRGRDA